MVVGGGNGGGQQAPPWTAARPSISIPPRASMEVGGAPVELGLSPGPMTLLSNLFGDNDECKSFSELLAGAMVENGEGAPPGLSMFTVPPGLSPAAFLHSPPPQGHFGMSHQQALAQVSSQAVQAHSNVQIQAEHPFSVSVAPAISLMQVPSATFSTAAQQLIPHSMPDSGEAKTESFDYSHSEQRLQSSSANVGKPNDDGYNWRKYGQKQVKGCEFPRSYYKCTHPSCPVKKKVERSLDGHVTAIIYKGEHNHQRPHPSKLTKDNLTTNENSNVQDGISSHPMSKIDPESSQATAEHVSGTSDSEEVGDHENEVDEKNDEPDPKRRNTEVRLLDPTLSHRAVSEPRIIVQTTSDVDLLDDGYRWRKYGQKVVKGNPYPRSYYKCTTPGCNVRKHIERASTDPKAVMTTYEGKHNHDVPVAKTNSHALANDGASQLKSQNTIPETHDFNSRSVGGNKQQPVAVARLRLKEEQIT